MKHAVLLGLVGAIESAQAAPPATQTFGQSATDGGWTDISPNFIEGDQVTAPVAGNLTKISVYADGNGSASSGNQALVGAVYADSAGAPRALLGTSSEVTIVKGQAAGWVDLPFPTPVAVTSGTAYWLLYAAGGAQGTKPARVSLVAAGGPKTSKLLGGSYPTCPNPYGSGTPATTARSVTATVEI